MPIQQKQPVKPIPEKTAYITGPGSYNRESGKKTLVFVSILIIVVTILVLATMYMINRKFSVMIQ